jgi:hypothetical protein
MATKRTILTALLVAAVVGCSQQPSAGPAPAPAATAADHGKLDAAVLADKPTGAISVKEAMTRKDGEKVVVTGQVPPEKVKPYNSAVASFVMLSPEDMSKEEVKDEFDCPDAATCPSCRKLLDELAVQVEVVDGSGAPVPASLEGYRGLKPGSTVTVQGEVRRYGKDKKLVRIVATKFYPG